MGFGFRKSIKIAPGLKLNIGKESVGISVGGKLGRVSVNSKTGAKVRVSLPGTGIYYSTKIGDSKSTKKKSRASSKTTSNIDLTEINRNVQVFETSLKLIMETTNPKTYFGRYNDAENAMIKLAELTSHNVVHGQTPKEVLEMLTNDKTAVTNAFLDRYSAEILVKAETLTRGKKNKVETFMTITEEYEAQMTTETIAYRDGLYKSMVQKIGLL